MTSKSKWDNLVENYTERIVSPFFSDETVNNLLSLFPKDIGTGRILDVGCGKGYLLNKIIGKYEKVSCFCGIDISSGMLRFAQGQTDKKLSFLSQSSSSNMPFSDNSFNLITSINSIIMDTPLIRYSSFKEIGRLLESSGTFIAILPSNENHSEQMYYLKKQYENEGYSESESIQMVYDDLNSRLYDPIGGYINIADEDLRIKLYSKFEISDILRDVGFKNIEIKPFSYPLSMIKELSLVSGSNGIYDWFITASSN